MYTKYSASRQGFTSRLCVGLELLILLLSASGCPHSDEGRGITEITVLTWKPNEPGAWEAALAQFHEGNPGIHVRLEIQPRSTTQYHDVLSQRLRSDPDSVDVFLMDVIWPPAFASAGWAAHLDDIMGSSERKSFFPGCVEAVTYNGHVYGVPFNTDSGLLYYRKDLLTKYGFQPPSSWEEMLRQVEKVQAGERDANLHGFSGQFKQYEGLVCNMLEFIGSNGGSLLEPDKPEALQAIRFVRDRLIGSAAPRGVLTYEEPESLDLFKSGGAIFHRNWPYAWRIVNDETESSVASNVGIARLPSFQEGHSVATLGGWSFGIASAAPHPKAARRFVKFMTSRDMQKHFAVNGGKAPARMALYDDSEVLAANPHFAEFYGVFETAVPRPRSPVYARLSNLLQPFLHRAISRADEDLPAASKRAAQEIRKETEKVR